MFYTEVRNVLYMKLLTGDLTMPQNMQSCPLMPTVKPSFVIFDIRAELASIMVPRCQKLKMTA